MIRIISSFLFLFLGTGAAAQNCTDDLVPDMGLLGKVRVNNDSVYNVAVEGDIAFMGSTLYVYAVDISNPARPMIIGEYLKTQTGSELAISGGLICLVSYHDELQFLDATDPTNMTLVKTLPNFPGAASVIAHGNYFYIAGGYSGLATIDASDPADPVVSLVMDPSPNINRMAIKGNYLYSVGNNDPMCVFHLGDPANPSFIYQTPGYSGSDLEIVGDYIYRTSIYANRRYMSIFHIQPHSGLPAFVRSKFFDFEFRYLTSIGNTLYCSGEPFINAVDLGDPEDPQFIGQMFYDESIGDMVPYGDVLLCDVNDHILMNVKIGQPEPPILANLWGPAAPAYEFEFHDDLYFHGAAGDGLQIWEYDNYPPTSTVALTDTLHAIKRVGDLVYLAIDEDGLQIADISDPANPVLVGGVNTSSESRDVDVYTNESGTYSLMALRAQDLIKHDVTDPGNISYYGLNSFPGHVYAVEVVGDHLLVADTGGHLNVMDLSVFPDQPEVVTVLDLPGAARTMYVKEGLCYIGGERFLAVVDITDPAVPILMGSTDTRFTLLDLVVEGTVAYGILGAYGVVVAEVGDPSSPSVLCEAPTPSEPLSVAVYEGEVHVSTLEYGLVSMPLHPSTSVTAVETPEIPLSSRIAVYPNPFNPSTTIRFETRRAGPVHLAVYDLAGRQVTQILDGWLDAGTHQKTWNGRDKAGRSVASGPYLVRLKTADRVETRKVLLAK